MRVHPLLLLLPLCGACCGGDRVRALAWWGSGCGSAPQFARPLLLFLFKSCAGTGKPLHTHPILLLLPLTVRALAWWGSDGGGLRFAVPHVALAVLCAGNPLRTHLTTLLLPLLPRTVCTAHVVGVAHGVVSLILVIMVVVWVLCADPLCLLCAAVTSLTLLLPLLPHYTVCAPDVVFPTVPRHRRERRSYRHRVCRHEVLVCGRAVFDEVRVPVSVDVWVPLPDVLLHVVALGGLARLAKRAHVEPRDEREA